MATRAMPSARRLIWERDGGVCQICQLPVPFDRSMHVDHLVPYKAGGCGHPENLRTTHRLCNLKRRDPGPGVSHCPPLPYRPRKLYVPRARRPKCDRRSVSLTPKQWAWLESQSRLTGLTVSKLVEQAIEAAMNAAAAEQLQGRAR